MIAMMNDWVKAHSTGVAKLDEDHTELFQWLSDLESAAAEQRTLFGVYALTRLKHYARDHFASEEAMMKAAGYPDLEAHIAEHAKYRERLGELHLKSIGTDISMETVELLRDWLTNHISKTDMAYVPHMKKLKQDSPVKSSTCIGRSTALPH